MFTGTPITPRWYQTEADEALWAALFPFTGRNPVIVLPTGAGKSVSIAMFCKRVLANDGRAVILQHRAELCKQNFDKIADLVGLQNVGMYSAGLKSRELEQPIIVASIQSIYNKAHLLGRRHAAFIDEVHLCGQDGDSMYRTFLDSLATINPNLRIAGCTATPFRTDSGPICSPDGVFHKVAYSVPVARLIAEGFLCSITNQATETAYDTSGLHVRGGEFVPREVEALFDSDQIKIDAACAEIVKKCHGRHSILVFCSGVRHCERVSATLARLSGEEVGIVVGTTGQLERAATLAAFRAGRMRFLCGVDVLTTGFDAPTIDAIAILRATESAGLLAQIIGRGFRIHESKTDCLVLDFGGNLERHGPIDSPDYGARRGGHGETTGEAPTKSCPNCHSCCAISATACAACGFEFPARELKHGTEADTRAALLSAPVVPVTWLVRDWHAGRHQKKWRRCDQGCQILGPGDVCRDCGTVRPVDTFRVDYTCDPTDREPTLIGEIISEWVCLEHSGFVQTRAFQWWGLHTLAPVPSGIDEALDMFAAGALGRPTEITTIQDGRFKKITGRVVPVRPATWAGESDEGGDSDDFAPREFAGASSEDIPF